MITVPAILARRTPLAAVLAASIALGASGSATFAQDGTGAATPTPPSACEIVPATATGADAATPVAAVIETPAATPSTGTGNIPVVFIGASPEAGDAGESATATAAADPLAQDIQAAATAIAACLSDSRFDTLTQITGDAYRGKLIGFGSPLTGDEFTLLAPMLPEVPYQILSVENVTRTSDTTATAEVTYELAHQVRRSTWTFELQEVDGHQVWTLQDETAMTPVSPANTDTLSVQITDEGYTIQDATVQGPSVAIEASNSDDEDHEILVLRLDSGVTTDALLTNPDATLPEGVTYIGQATVPAGASGTLLLSGLQPGTYTIVDLLPNAEGLPNLTEGMEITFEVE